jgi:hypothetical protein
VKSSHATAQEVVERLPDDPDEESGSDADADGDDEKSDDETRSRRTDRERLGSRENFWGK